MTASRPHPGQRMPSGQRCWRTSAKHLASSNSPERLTRSDAGMIARAPCMKTAAAHHPIRSLARRLPAPLPLITPEANKSHQLKEVEKKRVVEKLVELKRSSSVRSGRAYDASVGSWLDNALTQHAIVPFRVIIAS